MTEYYAVVRDRRNANDNLTFSKFHESYYEAVNEATRLSQKEGAKFWVLKMVGYAHIKPAPVEFVVTGDNP